jgi:hypothetical protein
MRPGLVILGGLLVAVGLFFCIAFISTEDCFYKWFGLPIVSDMDCTSAPKVGAMVIVGAIVGSPVGVGVWLLRKGLMKKHVEG